MKLPVEQGGLTGREVARRMGLASTAAVSRLLKALEAELPKNPALSRLLDQASRQIRTEQQPLIPISNN
jgi:transcriptional regulator with XRE-family HTH domain